MVKKKIKNTRFVEGYQEFIPKGKFTIETKHKRNYSLGWLIFWIIVCFPVAYYYYFKKQYLNKSISKEKPQKYIFIVLIIFYIFLLIIGSTAEQQTVSEQSNVANIPAEESETAVEELIREAEEIRDAKERFEMSDEFKAFSEACQAECEALYPSSAQDMEYTECVVACVLG